MSPCRQIRHEIARYRAQVARYFSARCILRGLVWALARRAERWIEIARGRTGRRWDRLDKSTRAPLTQMIARYWFGEGADEGRPGEARMIGAWDDSPGPPECGGKATSSGSWEQLRLLFQPMRTNSNLNARATARAQYCMIHPREKP